MFKKGCFKRLEKCLETAHQINLSDYEKIVIMSDLHRGIGDRADNAYGNRLLYQKALQFYNKNKYLYIELGDCDELWENEHLQDIIKTYPEIFELLEKFHKNKRFITVYGNHDILKSDPKWVAKSYEESTLKDAPIFESIVLNDDISERRSKYLLVHGHHGSPFNLFFWKIGRWLIRHIWRFFETGGIHEPVSVPMETKKTGKTEALLTEFAGINQIKIICGHTHIPKMNDTYINTGSGVAKDVINALEIVNGELKMYDWKEILTDRGRRKIDRVEKI